MMSDDHDLRSRFDALRRVDAAAVPEVDELVARTHARPSRRVMLPAMAAAAAAIAMLVAGLRFATSRPSDGISVSLGEPSILVWRSPTVSLLQTPGKELLQTVPTLGSSLP